VQGEKPREIAVSVLNQRKKGRFIEVLLEEALAASQLRPEDRRLLQELVYGVARWELTLDWLIARKTGRKTQKPMVQNLLRLALYQMFWMDRVPSYAAVNETVEICKSKGLLPQARFVNALLRAYGREAAETHAKLNEFRKTDLSLGYSHPEWLCRRWQERWGEEATAMLLEWNNAPPPTYARVNRLKVSADELIAVWQKEGVSFEEGSFDWIPAGTVWRLLQYSGLGTLESFRSGLFYIQDPSTLLAPGLLQARPGENVLDLCAAPGGKTTYLAQLMRNQGRIVARDIEPARLDLVKENAERLGASCVEITPATEEFFDRVLVDAPCSNTGVMRRRVELRWRIRPEEIQRLALTQHTLLAKAAKHVRAGGTIVYSTCSLEPEENERVVRGFLETHSEFRLDLERELTPVKDRVDGAYCARFIHAI
jgi:16S rRNA (cytosine967-C5)-methyltransferase